jgi:phage-related protein
MAEPYFIWKNTNSNTMGIVVNEYPNPAKPAERVKEIVVPGRAGTLTETEGEEVYDNVVLTCQCSVLPTADLHAISAWLRGSGTVVFGNDATKCYTARLDSQLDFERLVSVQVYREVAIPFACQPFKYLTTPGTDIVETVSGQTVTNAGTVFSLPKIKVEGSGDITLTIGTKAIQLTGLTDGIIIDSELVDAYDLTATVLMNEQMVGDFPTLPVGTFAVSWTGTVTKVTITPRWRWL